MPETAQPYNALIMDHIRHARNYFALDDANRTACGVNPLCGDEVTVFLRVEQNRIASIAFQWACCGISMAAASMMTDLIKGKDVVHARNVLRAFKAMLRDRTDARSGNATRELYAIRETVHRFPTRDRCAVLPWEVLEAALDNQQVSVSAGR